MVRGAKDSSVTVLRLAADAITRLQSRSYRADALLAKASALREQIVKIETD
jgi:hypothetical protein